MKRQQWLTAAKSLSRARQPQYKKASIAETVKEIPLDRILLETDSPYLTPVPFRGKRNESSYVPYIAEKLSELTGKGIDEIASQTTENAVKLFRL